MPDSHAFWLSALPLMKDWNIQGRASACQSCGQRFVDGQPYHSLLWQGDRGYRRLDVCGACWERQYRQEARIRREVVSYWRGVYESPPPPVEPIRRDAAESLLRRLCELADPRYRPVGYILAVMLERKRLLKVKEQFWREGQRVFVYEHTRSGDVFTVPDPALRLSELEEVQRTVARLLEEGLPAGAESGPVVEPAAGPAAGAGEGRAELRLEAGASGV